MVLSILESKVLSHASTRMIGIFFLVAACAVQGTVAGFLRGTVVPPSPPPPSMSLVVYDSPPLLFVPPVSSATRRRREAEAEAEAVMEAAPILITDMVAVPLPQPLLLRKRQSSALTLPPPSPSHLFHPIHFHTPHLQYPAGLQQYPVVPYIGSRAELEGQGTMQNYTNSLTWLDV